MDILLIFIENPPLFGRGSEFGLEKLLQIFGLLPGDTKTDPNQVRDSLGLWEALPLKNIISL